MEDQIKHWLAMECQEQIAINRYKELTVKTKQTLEYSKKDLLLFRASQVTVVKFKGARMESHRSAGVSLRGMRDVIFLFATWCVSALSADKARQARCEKRLLHLAPRRCSS